MAQTEEKFRTFIKVFTGQNWERKTFPLDKAERSERLAKKKEDKFYPAWFIVDGYNSDYQIAWEYDGPRHYNDQEVIEKDNKRRKLFNEDINIKRLIEFPFFCTFTEEIVRHYFFQPLFSGDERRFREAMKEKYKDALQSTYHGCAGEAPPPGWNTSPHNFFTFTEDGKKRFLRELEALPEKTQKQILSTMKQHYTKTSQTVVDKILSLER